MIRNNILILITPGRSGSEHLLQTLNSCAGLRLAGEVFNQSNFDASSFNGFIRSRSLYKVIGYVFNRNKVSRARFNVGLSVLIQQFLAARFSDDTIIPGFKLTLDQLETYPYLWKLLESPSTKLIYLTKKNKLALALSLIKARKINRYHGTSDPDKKSYTFDIEEAVRQVSWLQKAETGFLARIKVHPHAVLLDTDSLFQHYDTVMSDILHLLHLPANTTFHYSELRPTNPPRLEEWVNNLAAIQDALAGYEITL